MPHSKITHCNIQYNFDHLAESYRSFSWTGQDASKLKFECRIRFSNHCYSEEIKGTRLLLNDDFIIPDRGATRVFCPLRYDNTKKLEGMLSVFFDKPTISVGITYESNCHIYQLYQNNDKSSQDRFCVFFKLSLINSNDSCASTHKLDLFVESAYVRSNRVDIRGNQMFGRIAERVAKKQNIL